MTSEARRVWDRMEWESHKAYEAFLFYCEMGPDRSLSNLSKALGKSKSLLSRWSARYDWFYRSSTYDKDLHEMVMKDMASEMADIERRKLEVIRKTLDVAELALKGIDEDKLKPLEILEMIKVGIHLEREILGLDKPEKKNNNYEFTYRVINSDGSPYYPEHK
jgi:hypothetical protein